MHMWDTASIWTENVVIIVFHSQVALILTQTCARVHACMSCVLYPSTSSNNKGSVKIHTLIISFQGTSTLINSSESTVTVSLVG